MEFKKIQKPIFFIGAPRSGTTLIFEVFSKHPKVSWLMNYNDFFPNITIINAVIPLLNNKYIDLIGKKKQYNNLGYFNKYKPKPDECYRFWAEHTPEVDFSRDFLLNKKAKEDTAEKLNKIIFNINKYQKKERFTTKLTGPGRIEYLKSIFPDAIFIHIIRDGRSVVQSLMNVNFWKSKVIEPWFINGLSKSDLDQWQNSGRNPVVLTTLLWNKIIEHTQSEALKLNLYDKQYIELKYEDFIANPEEKLKEILDFSGLSSDEEKLTQCLDGTKILKNMNKKFTSHFDDELQSQINLILSDKLRQLNYI